MTTTFLLIRHATTDAVVGRCLAGRAPGVHLNQAGRDEVARLVARLAGAAVGAVYSSPLERALETAEPLARSLGLEVRALDPLNELDFGRWTGLTFEELERDPLWRRFNSFRSGARAPGGELMIEAQARIVAEVERLRLAHAGETIAVVSHGDPLKAVIAHYTGIPLDLFRRVEISPASVSILEVGEEDARVLLVNGTGNL